MIYNIETFPTMDELCGYLNFWDIKMENIVGIYRVDPGWKLLYLTTE